MTHHEILSEENFSVNFVQIFSLIVQVMYILVSQKMIVLQNIIIQMMWILDQQKDKNYPSDWFWYGQWTWNSAGEGSFASTIEDNISQKLDLTGVSGITIEM